MNFDPLAGLPGQPIQQFWNEQWSRTLQILQQMGSPGMPGAQGAGMPDMAQAWKAAVPEPGALPENALSLDPEKLLELQRQYLDGAKAMCEQGGAQALLAKDKRFNTQSWADNPLTAATAATYLLNSRMLMGLAEAVQADEKTRNRVRFAVEQWLAAMSPSNFLALNAEAQKKAIETQGESLALGVANLLADMRQGHVSMTDESLFTVGKNVATTEGAVVFENELFQLIEYKPLTDKVHERPFLMVPPCINKFYILDLQPDNSLIRYAVSQGHRTFVMSWRNPDDSLAHKTWDNYIEDGVLTGIRVAREIAGAEQINVLGFCVGGTMLSTALAVLAQMRTRPVVVAATLGGWIATIALAEEAATLAAGLVLVDLPMTNDPDVMRTMAEKLRNLATTRVGKPDYDVRFFDRFDMIGVIDRINSAASQINIPVLFVSGARSNLTGGAQAASFVNQLPDVEAIEVEDSGLLVTAERTAGQLIA